MEVAVIANLLLCTVRNARDVDRRFCFEVVSPNETFVFQSENDVDFSDWFQVLYVALTLVAKGRYREMSTGLVASAGTPAAILTEH